jgi:WXG100 family type VII secretion target
MTAYDVDLDELATVLAAMATCQRGLGDLARDVDAETSRLHASWTGRAQEAHAAAHTSWRDGFADMVTALAGLRGLAATARDAYAGAGTANRALWEQVR